MAQEAMPVKQEGVTASASSNRAYEKGLTLSTPRARELHRSSYLWLCHSHHPAALTTGHGKTGPFSLPWVPSQMCLWGQHVLEGRPKYLCD